jgi:hypothetical protein
MSHSIPRKRGPIKVRPQGTNHRKTKLKKRQTDLRKQLFNSGKVGPMGRVSLPLEMVTTLLGILLDLDSRMFRDEIASAKVRSNPKKFYNVVVQPLLVRHPVLSKAEVRNSGRGLHIILWLIEPVEFTTETERARWAAITKVIQRLLPTDADCPGLTALTRALGSTNSKNGAKVTRLYKGEPVSADDVLNLFNQARSKPFRTLAEILFGTLHISPCPICKGDGTKLDALDRVGMCYGSCGKVGLEQLYDVFLKPRPSIKEE